RRTADTDMCPSSAFGVVAHRDVHPPVPDPGSLKGAEGNRMTPRRPGTPVGRPMPRRWGPTTRRWAPTTRRVASASRYGSQHVDLGGDVVDGLGRDPGLDPVAGAVRLDVGGADVAGEDPQLV